MKTFASIAAGGLGAVLSVFQIVLSLFQLAAVVVGAQVAFGLPWWAGCLLIIPIFAVPFLGVFLGIWGAIVGWHYEWWQAGLLFFGPQLFIFVLSMIFVSADHIAARRN